MSPTTVFFPEFDHPEGRSQEMRLVAEGLALHDQILLTHSPRDADHIILLQNHVYDHNPFGAGFRQLKRDYCHKTVFLDFDDWPEQLFDDASAPCRLYFKRSVVDKGRGKPALRDYGGLPVEPLGYAAMAGSYFRGPESKRSIDIACLFNDAVINDPYHGNRGRVLDFLRRQSFPDHTTLFDAVTTTGPAGRETNNPTYLDTLRNTRILVTCNPDKWEGDSRLWEALASGCLVFVDRMLTPILHPLVHHRHLMYYDLSDDGLEEMLRQIHRFLDDEDGRKTISRQGHAFVGSHHLSVNRIQQVLDRLSFQTQNQGSNLIK